MKETERETKGKKYIADPVPSRSKEKRSPCPTRVKKQWVDSHLLLVPLIKAYGIYHRASRVVACK